MCIGFSDRAWRNVPEVDPDTRGQTSEKFEEQFLCTSLNEPVDEVVVPEVVHAGGEVTEHEEPLVLVEPEVVLGVVEEVEERSAWKKQSRVK